MSLNTVISDLDQQSNIKGCSNLYYNQEDQQTVFKQSAEPHLMLIDQEAADIIASIQTNILQSTILNNTIALDDKSEKLSENSTTSNKVLSDLANKPIASQDSYAAPTKVYQNFSPSSQKTEVEGEDNKENESVNSSILSNIQNNLCTPVSPCGSNSPSRVLKSTQNSRSSSSSSKCAQKNDENEIQIIKNVSTKNSPQTQNNINNQVLSNCSNLNKQSFQQQTQQILQNVACSPFKERDQNKEIQQIILSNSQNQTATNSINNSSEKKEKNHQIQQVNNSQIIEQEINNINQINEPLIIQKNQLNSLSDQENSSEQQLTITKEILIESITSENPQNENEQQENSSTQEEADYSQEEKNDVLQQIQCYQIDNFQDVDSQLNEENTVAAQIEKEEIEIKDINVTEEVESSDSYAKMEQNQEYVSKDEQQENLINAQVSSLQEETIQQQLEQQIEENGIQNNNQSDISEKENQSDQDLVVDDEDRNIYQPIGLIGAEDEEEEQESQYQEGKGEDIGRDNSQSNSKKYQEEIDQNDKENQKEYSDKENIEYQEKSYNSQEVEEKQERDEQQEQNDEDQHVEKSENVRHLENYQSIIRETDSYLDQLVMYILKEKATLTNIQKSIQVNHSKREHSPSNSQKNNKQYNNSTKQDEAKQKKYQEEKDEYQYNSQNQREEDKAHRTVLSSSNSLSNSSKYQQSSYQQSQNSSKNYSQQTQYQQMVTRNQQVYSHVNEILQLSIDSIKFGVVFPGNIFEEQVQIVNKTNETVFIKVVGLCLNPEFDSHGEYVYSIRKTINYDYNEKLMFSIPGYQSIKVHIALKVPNINEEKLIKGSFAVTVNGYDSYISIPITSSVEIPKIVCTRQLFHASRSSKVIKLAIRRGKKSDCKIPFKNTYGYTLQLEPFWLTEQTNSQHVTNLQDGSICPFSLNLSPQVITVQPKSLFMINLLLRPNQYFKEYNEKRLITGDKTPLHIKNVLIFRIVNSSLLFHYPVSLEVY